MTNYLGLAQIKTEGESARFDPFCVALPSTKKLKKKALKKRIAKLEAALMVFGNRCLQLDGRFKNMDGAERVIVMYGDLRDALNALEDK